MTIQRIKYVCWTVPDWCRVPPWQNSWCSFSRNLPSALLLLPVHQHSGQGWSSTFTLTQDLRDQTRAHSENINRTRIIQNIIEVIDSIFHLEVSFGLFELCDLVILLLHWSLDPIVTLLELSSDNFLWYVMKTLIGKLKLKVLFPFERNWNRFWESPSHLTS